MEKLHLKGEYHLLDYNISHKVLLLRNYENYESEGSNTDIVFESVFYLEIPTKFNDIVLYEADEDDVKEVQRKIDETNFNGFDYNIYILESAAKKYYVGCWRFLIEKNSHYPLVSSIK